MPTFNGRRPYVTSKLSSPDISTTSVLTTSLTVNWTAETNALVYTLQRSTAADFSLNLTTLYVGIGLTYSDTGLTSNTEYFYRVKAKGIGYLDSVYTATSVTTASSGGSALSTPTVSRLGYGRNSISIAWPSVSSATNYIVQRATNPGFTVGLTTLYSGLASGVTREFQPGYVLEYHDSGLTAGTTYYYRVKATGAGHTDSAYGTKTITTGSAYKTATISGPTQIIGGMEEEFQWYDGSQVQNIHGGDTVAISPPSGGADWQYMVWANYHGTPTEPLTVRNNGQIKMTAGMSLLSCSYINITGNHVSKTDAKGIFVEGSGGGACFEINGLSHHITIDNIKTRGGAYAMRLKNEANSFATETPECGIQYMWPSHMHDIEISYWDCSEHSQDGFYIGSSGPWGGRTFTCTQTGQVVNYRPTGLANIHVHHVNMSYCGRSGFQMGCMDMGTNSFHDNVITECGFEYAVDQGAGMAIGGANASLNIYNNTISRTFREPVYTYNYGQMYLHDNDFDEAGTITVEPLRVFFWTKITLTGGQTLSSSWMDSSPGKTIRDDQNEYYFEFFLNQSGNPLIKTQRIGDANSTTSHSIPTTPGTSRTLTVQTGRTYPNGSTVRVVNDHDKSKWWKGTVTSYNSGTGELILSSTSNNGTGTYRVWVVYKENRLPEEAIAAIGQVAPGSHAGTQLDPFAGFGASSPITSGQVSYPTEISIPNSQAVGNFLMNCFSTDSVDIYGSPAGLTTFRIENNTFGSQKAASTKVISFINSHNLYGTGNVICGNTYLGSALTESNISKPGGGVVTYTLSDSCVPTSTLVESNETYSTGSGPSPGGLKWLPSDYSDPANSSKTYPIIIFLHGAGESSGTRNNALLKSTSLPEIITTDGWEGISQDPVSGQYHQFLVFAPQAPGWSYSGGDLGSILTDIMARFRVDTNRIYVTGLSAGGSGSISVGDQAVLRNNVAAIVPIAAAGFNTGGQDTNFDNIMLNNIEMLNIVGFADSWKTFANTLTTRYNSYSPAPANAAELKIVPDPANHDESTWNVCFGTSFDVGDGNNVYEWMLKHHK